MYVCPACDAALPSWLVKTGATEMLCPACFRNISIQLFPAAFGTRQRTITDTLPLAEGQSCCYEHSTRPAVEACHRCGRFVCTLCEVEMHGQVWCPICIENSRRNPADAEFQTSRVLYDSIALAVAGWPLLTIYFWIFGAPIAIYVALRYWKRPSSIIPRTKWRFVLALLLGVIELGLLALFVFSIVLMRKGRLVE